MPRPIRIEYENAYYHVMNRGRGGDAIFHGEAYFSAFLNTLNEAHQRFGVEVLCYCLMDNHYHLLLKTPEANLGRAMRHINGVYTQRYNRLMKTDGSLFRGRYKAILVEENSYQLQLSRYIHRNPLESGMTDDLLTYPWSSYPAYVGNKVPPKWLYCRDVYQQLQPRRPMKECYRAFVEMGVDEEIAQFYGKGNQMPYLGSDEFRAWAYSQRDTDESEVSKVSLKLFRPTLDQVMVSVATIFDVEVSDITRNQRGRRQENIPRWVVMYLGQILCGLKLCEIAEALGLKRTGSIPTTIAKLRERMMCDKKLARDVIQIRREYDPYYKP